MVEEEEGVVGLGLRAPKYLDPSTVRTYVPLTCIIYIVLYMHYSCTTDGPHRENEV